MEILALTIFISLLLAVGFLLLFVTEGRRNSDFGGIERDSLLPLDEKPVVKPSEK